ncbi:energy-coupling factor ABC transporter ATP-binding protein [Mobilicoccus pelagius]|uniref:ABC transporter ATP-binding protein n=1 Tax=Mobilicoccus pelagius NBRC 104925 TaxID=1089455 RepID=H5UP02_9MICO|nr:ATP-binding cassette domain-containing protein [Mobilicoccus pelagius]GAB47460.1 cobalt transport ATP-binding protein CbiO [Mobilicoccus pelagius NBRC 104925]
MSHQSLHAEGLVFGYDGAPVLDAADLTIAGGTRIALLGANGSGKTTLLRCLSAALQPQAGRVLLDGAPVRYDRAGLRHHRQNVQLVLQDPDDQLFSADVRRDVSFGPLNLGLSEAETVERVDEALDLLGITHLADRPVHQLSYGQRKRAAIAGAVAMRPCLLLLDEPTAGLDPAGVDEMFTALARLEEHATTVVLATHDVDLALAWAQDCAVVLDGRVVQGDPVDLLDRTDLLRAARLRRPWVLDLAARVGLAHDPDAAPLCDLDGIAERLRGRLLPTSYPRPAH